MAGGWRQNLRGGWKSKSGWSMSCFEQVHDRLLCFTLHSFEGSAGAQQSRVSSQTQKQNSVWHRRQLTVQPQRLQFMTVHRASVAISGTDILPTHSRCHRWLDRVTLTFVCSSCSSELYRLKFNHRTAAFMIMSQCLWGSAIMWCLL